MANRLPSFNGALVPIAGPTGEVQWQGWTYGELIQHLQSDLDLGAQDISSLAGYVDGLNERAYRSAAFGPLVANTWVTFPMDTRDPNTGNAHMNLTTGGFTAPATGIYDVRGEAAFSPNASNYAAYVTVVVGGAANISVVGKAARGNMTTVLGGSGLAGTVNAAGLLRMAAGDTVFLVVWCNVAVSMFVVAGSISLDNYLEARRVA